MTVTAVGATSTNGGGAAGSAKGSAGPTSAGLSRAKSGFDDGGSVPARWPASSPSVWMVPRCSGLTSAAPGNRSCRADMISTRLIESTPRSASRAMVVPSISGG